MTFGASVFGKSIMKWDLITFIFIWANIKSNFEEQSLASTCLEYFES